MVGRVLAELKKAGFAKNTLIMLKSDHGIPVPFAKTNVGDIQPLPMDRSVAGYDQAGHSR